MVKFNKLFVEGQTKVKLFGDTEFHLVEEIYNTRKLIKIVNHVGSLQRGHIEKFTNK